MNKKEPIIGIFVGAIILVGLVFVLRSVAPQAGNTITSNGIVPVASAQASTPVGPQNALTIAAAVTQCNSRIISTASTSVMLSFKSTFTPTLVLGIWQAASSTKEYDNAIYGCGAITAVANSSSTVNVLTTSI